MVGLYKDFLGPHVHLTPNFSFFPFSIFHFSSIRLLTPTGILLHFEGGGGKDVWFVLGFSKMLLTSRSQGILSALTINSPGKDV